jgi:hypothetical protein
MDKTTLAMDKTSFQGERKKGKSNKKRKKDSQDSTRERKKSYVCVRIETEELNGGSETAFV